MSLVDTEYRNGHIYLTVHKQGVRTSQQTWLTKKEMLTLYNALKRGWKKRPKKSVMIESIEPATGTSKVEVSRTSERLVVRVGRNMLVVNSEETFEGLKTFIYSGYQKATAK